MYRGALFALCLIGTACYPKVQVVVSDDPVGGSDTGSSHEDGDGDAPELVVGHAEPYDGSTEGGLAVTVVGGPFSEDSTATIGGNTAAVALQSETELLLTVPASDETGAVDIVITDGESEGRAASGFRYWESQEGQATHLVSLLYTEVIDPTAFADAGLSRDDGLEVWVAILEGADVSPVDALAPELGTCGSSSLSIVPVDGPSAVRLRLLSGDELSIEQDTDGAYTSVPTVSSTWSEGAQAGLSTDPATYPGVSAPLLTASAAFSLDSVAVPESLASDSLELAWSGGPEELVLIELADEAAGTHLACLFEDSGSAALSADDLDDLALSDTTDVVLRVTGLSTTSVQLDFDDSEIRGVLGHGQTTLVELSP